MYKKGVLLLLIGRASSFELTWGACALTDVTPVGKLDQNLFAGEWYELARETNTWWNMWDAE